MQLLQKIPLLFRWIINVVLIFLTSMFIARLIFYFNYNPLNKPFSGSAFILGLRFDVRVVSIVGLFILILCYIPLFNPFKNKKATIFWNIFLPLVYVIFVLFYCIDFYHYDYLHQRLNASVLNYLQDAGISYKMMWQTYPLIKVLMVLLFIAAISKICFSKLLNTLLKQNKTNFKKSILKNVLFFLILAQCIVGKILIKPGQFPLRWSDAFTLSDDFKSSLALNPFQSFFSTLSFRKSTFNINEVKKSYPLIANYLGIKNKDSFNLNFKRDVTISDSIENKPNIVLVICESFSAYKSTMYNNTLNTTPFFNELCKNGVFFDRCFTPAYGTARGVWAIITGIPDVEGAGTASRNPNAVNQKTIINDFNGYNNYYFLGGSANWANIRGLLTNNINSLNLYEEDKYTSPKIDVWGISDKNLFLEANKVLKQQNKPFFAIIQTADNHRPYTIPKEDLGDFKLEHISIDSLKQFGFENNEELNAFRFTDYCYKQFIDEAKKENYFNNTIFVFVGDHGIRYGGALNYMPKSYVEEGLTCEQVPLLFYAPKLLKPQRINKVCSQLDVLPSVASLAKIPYQNNTFGFNLFDTLNVNKCAFIIDHDAKTIGVINNQYYYLKNIKTQSQNFVSIIDNLPIPLNKQTDSIKNYLSKLTDGYYETAKYMLFNNKK